MGPEVICMYTWLILSILSAALSILNLYIAFSRGNAINFLVCVIWLLAAYKNFDTFRKNKE